MDFQFSVPFTKVDKARRMVTGIATADNVDKEDDIIDFAGSVDAFNSWPGNVREMHMPKAVGKMVDFKPVAVKGDGGEVYSGMETTIYISKGAEDTWTKVLDGTLQGFSVGGDIVDSDYEFNKTTNKSYRRVKKYTMHELSLVDNPANPVSKFTMIKSAGKNDAGEDVLELQGTNNFNDIKPLFYCDVDGIAKVGESFCGDHEMTQIGFIEGFDNQEIKKMIESYENHKNGGEKSESVLHKSANTDIVNNMEELNEVQKESLIKRFTKVLFDNEESDDTPKKDNIDGLFAPVFNINVPTGSTVETVNASHTSEVTDEEEVTAETEEVKVENVEAADEADAITEGGGDNVDTNEVVEKVTGTLLEKLDEISKSFDAKIESLEKSVDEKVDSVKAEVDTAKGELDKFANDGAISKSVETDSGEESNEVNETEVTKVQTDSFWKGAFVDEEIISALGYES